MPKLPQDIDERQCLASGLACDNADMPDLVKVLSVPSIMEGEGIPVLLKGGGSDPYGSGVAYVFVPTEFEAQARLLLEDVSDGTT